MTDDETLDEMIANLPSTFVLRASSFLLNIQVANIERVVLDELATRFDDVAHEDGKHFVGVDSVVVVEIDFEELALLGVHRGVEEFLGVHFAQAFEALDLHPAPANLDDLLMDLGD